MTREEAISLIKSAQLMLINPTTNEPVSDLHMALDMAISALEQEPCDDAISREYLFKVLDDFCGHDRTATITLDTLADIVYELPSVTQKSGKWIDYREDGFVECPFCGHATNCEDDIDELHYCFHCGRRMVEPQESEE